MRAVRTNFSGCWLSIYQCAGFDESNSNGYEICSRLRKVAAFRDTPIVILTGNDGVIDRVRAKVVGATDFLTKPVESELVLEVAQKYLNPVSIE